MKHALLTLVLLLSILSLTSCGKPRARPTSSGDPVTSTPPTSDEDPIDWTKVKTQLVLFGAPPCSACKVAFPQIRNLLNAMPADQRAQIAVKLYVETGAGWFDAPTVEIAQKYRAAEGLRVPLAIDGFSKKTGKPNYSAMLDMVGDVFSDLGIDVGLPVAVILNKDGSFTHPDNKVPDIFPPGVDSFIPENIVARTVNHLTSEKQ